VNTLLIYRKKINRHYSDRLGIEHVISINKCDLGLISTLIWLNSGASSLPACHLRYWTKRL